MERIPSLIESWIGGIDMPHGLKERKAEFREPVKQHYAIFTEGVVTELAYFIGMKNAIEKDSVYKGMVYIQGTGCETQRVLEKAEDWVHENRPSNCQVWCIYDKDDFPKEDFNGVVTKIQALNKKAQNEVTYHAGWSNECFEYWLVLHFELLESSTGRASYTEKLKKYFQRKLHKNYSKEGKDCLELSEQGYPLLYEDMLAIGEPKTAIRNAERQWEEWKNRFGGEEAAKRKPSAAVPATMVHLLVKELARYMLPEEKKRFLDS